MMTRWSRHPTAKYLRSTVILATYGATHLSCGGDRSLARHQRQRFKPSDAPAWLLLSRGQRRGRGNGHDLLRRSAAYGGHGVGAPWSHVRTHVDTRPERQLGLPLPRAATYLSAAAILEERGTFAGACHD